MTGLPFICTLCKEQFANAVDALAHQNEKHNDTGMSLIGIQSTVVVPVEVTPCDQALEVSEGVSLTCFFDLGHRGLHFDEQVNAYWRKAMVLDGDDPEVTQTV